MKQEGLGLSLSGDRIRCHQTRTIRNEGLCGE